MNKYTAKQTSQFKKDLKRLIRQGKDMDKLSEVVDTLLAGKALDKKYKDHQLCSLPTIPRHPAACEARAQDPDAIGIRL